jgi:formylglycine-generating enzyme required for sulfatase activity
VLDLGGNLREWVSDRWTPVPFDDADDADAPPGARVLRGAGWATPAKQATTLLRAGEGLTEHFREASIGYRCAYEAGPAAP